MKKLSKKERGEVVTKGYLEDQEYVTNSYLKAQDYVTKSYLNEVLDKRFEEFRKEINKDFKYHIDVLIEHQKDQLQVLLEGLDNRYVLRSELRSDRV